jgi:tRNA 5-methylaminomethyl-2-thiouridine biosynthesis bifunctional protein
MSEPVEWLPDGTPRSPRFDDIYRSRTGGFEQARHVFLRGCGLPGAWADLAQWRILETGFGLGLNFLAAWRAWKDDARRCRLLHFVSLEAWPVSAADLVRSAAAYPELAPLARALAEQWFGLMPGVHRMAFEAGHVLLTLHIRDVKQALRDRTFIADSVFLDGFEPTRNPSMWDLYTLKSVARHCRRGSTIATWTVAGEVRRDLTQCGFAVEKVEGLAPKRQCLRGVFAPAWAPRGQRSDNAVAPAQCIVIGGGLAGASTAASLARRGWRVTVFDAAATPASGASGLPVGLLAPHFSADDNLLSRLSRSGVRATFEQARALLRAEQDWRLTGVLEHRADGAPNSASADDASSHWVRRASEQEKALAGLDADTQADWHVQAGWIKPAALVRAWLAQPGVIWRGEAKAQRLSRSETGWQLFDERDQSLGQAPLLVVAAANASEALLRAGLPLQPVRGQVSWARRSPGDALPPFPVKGNGHFIPDVPMGATAWFCGSTFQRGDADLSERAADHVTNLQRLKQLLPAVGDQLALAFAPGSVQAWTGVRCASADRRPLLGEIEPGLWVSTAMGSRGLTFAYLCAELLAARLHGEPLPLERKLAQALDVTRAREPRVPVHRLDLP